MRAAQIGFGFFGVLLTAVTTFMAFVEITTNPALRPSAVLCWSVGTLIESIHVYRLARSARNPSAWSWGVFAGALGLMILNMWHVMNDPTSRVVFSSAVAVGGLWLGASRAVTVGLGRWASARPAWAAVLCFCAWLPIEAPLIILLLR